MGDDAAPTFIDVVGAPFGQLTVVRFHFLLNSCLSWTELPHLSYSTDKARCGKINVTAAAALSVLPSSESIWQQH